MRMLQSYELQDDRSVRADTASVTEDAEEATKRCGKKFGKKLQKDTGVSPLWNTMQNTKSRWQGTLYDNENFEKMELFPIGRNGSSHTQQQNKLIINLKLPGDWAGLIVFFAVGIFKLTYTLSVRGTSKLPYLTGSGHKKVLVR